MKRRVRKKTSGKGAPKWMVTYSDMVTLILVFFILLFSMSQIDQQKFQAISQSFQERVIFDFLPSSVPMENPTNNPVLDDHQGPNKQDSEEFLETAKNNGEEETRVKEDKMERLVNEVEEFLDDNNLNGVITANRTSQGVELVLQDNIFFDTGEAVILNEGVPFLEKIGTLISRIPNEIKVEGHTDNRPIQGYRYPSNWELSGARASSVVRFLIEEFDIDEARFTIAGYGETRPIAPNDSAKNMSKNRRVEIVILDEKDED